MYGPSGKELGCFLVVFAAVSGALFVGAEHGLSWLGHHITVGWK